MNLKNVSHSRSISRNPFISMATVIRIARRASTEKLRPARRRGSEKRSGEDCGRSSLLTRRGEMCLRGLESSGSGGKSTDSYGRRNAGSPVASVGSFKTFLEIALSMGLVF